MKFIKWLVSFVMKGMDDNVMVYAAQAAYYLVLSVIPFIMILLSVIQFFIPIDKAEIIRRIPAVFSLEIQAYFKGIINEIFSKPAISLISVSAVTTLWSASRGFAAVERGVKNVYKIPKRKFFIVNILLSFLYTVIFTVVLILFLGVIVFGKAVLFIIDKHISWFSLDISFLEYIIFFLVAVAFFMILYASFTSRKIPLRCHLPGALFTGAGWILFSYIFSIYINNFANYSRIYGSLTAIVLMMLWLYSCMTILLYGAELNMELIRFKKIEYK